MTPTPTDLKNALTFLEDTYDIGDYDTTIYIDRQEKTFELEEILAAYLLHEAPTTSYKEDHAHPLAFSQKVSAAENHFRGNSFRKHTPSYIPPPSFLQEQGSREVPEYPESRRLRHPPHGPTENRDAELD